MLFDLSSSEVATILESLKYSRQRIQDAEGTPHPVRKENLARIDGVLEKLRQEGGTPQRSGVSDED